MATTSTSTSVRELIEELYSIERYESWLSYQTARTKMKKAYVSRWLYTALVQSSQPEAAAAVRFHSDLPGKFHQDLAQRLENGEIQYVAPNPQDLEEFQQLHDHVVTNLQDFTHASLKSTPPRLSHFPRTESLMSPPFIHHQHVDTHPALPADRDCTQMGPPSTPSSTSSQISPEWSAAIEEAKTLLRREMGRYTPTKSGLDFKRESGRRLPVPMRTLTSQQLDKAAITHPMFEEHINQITPNNLCYHTLIPKIHILDTFTDELAISYGLFLFRLMYMHALGTSQPEMYNYALMLALEDNDQFYAQALHIQKQKAPNK